MTGTSRQYSFWSLLAVAVVAIWTIVRGHVSNPSFDPKKNIISVESRKVLDSGQRFLLLSLDPMSQFYPAGSNTDTNKIFHGFSILGSAEIKDPVERAKLLKELYKGIANSDGMVAMCFNPRHGISASLGTNTVDLVICFECLQIAIYSGHTNGLLTSRSPQKTFNQALVKAGIPVAKSD